ncbi:hypothetical protein RJ639_020617, partial [Escallonia herrerae]
MVAFLIGKTICAAVLPWDHGGEKLASLDVCPSAVHEFRIPPKALLGLHTYCPVHFDAFHSVLVDISVHISLLKGGVYASPAKVHSEPSGDAAAGENYEASKKVMLVKAFIAARDIILEELQKLSVAINQTIDLSDFTSKLEEKTLFGSSPKADLEMSNNEVLGQTSSKARSTSEELNGSVDFQRDGILHSLSSDELFYAFHTLGDQILYLWNTFLKFHRGNKTKVLEFLRDAWANDRRAEWSIWMVYSKVEMPHQYISSEVDESTYYGVHGKAPPAQTAATRAELHRRSIAQMRINNRSIQDMHIFGDPSRIPIIIVERVVNAPMRSTSGNTYFSNLDQKDTHSILSGIGSKPVNKLSGASPRQSGRVLKIVVFVHGFQ